MTKQDKAGFERFLVSIKGFSAGYAKDLSSHVNRIEEALGIELTPEQLSSFEQLEVVLVRLENTVDANDYTRWKKGLPHLEEFNKTILLAYAATQEPADTPVVADSIKIGRVWKEYTQAMKAFKTAFGISTSNILGSVAELICLQHYKADHLLKNSEKSIDIVSGGSTYQVKARILNEKKSATALGVIRIVENNGLDSSVVFSFDYLVYLLFTNDGKLYEAKEVRREDLEAYINKKGIKKNSHQNGYVFTTTKDFLSLGNSIKENLAKISDLEIS